MKCPFCNSKKVVPNGDREHFCTSCKKLFDDDPDEGGSYSDRSPSARMERQERLQKKQMGGGPLRRMNRGYAGLLLLVLVFAGCSPYYPFKEKNRLAWYRTGRGEIWQVKLVSYSGDKIKVDTPIGMELVVNIDQIFLTFDQVKEGGYRDAVIVGFEKQVCPDCGKPTE